MRWSGRGKWVWFPTNTSQWTAHCWKWTAHCWKWTAHCWKLGESEEFSTEGTEGPPHRR